MLNVPNDVSNELYWMKETKALNSCFTFTELLSCSYVILPLTSLEQHGKLVSHKTAREKFASVNRFVEQFHLNFWMQPFKLHLKMEQLNSKIVNPFKRLGDWMGLST